MKFTGLAFLTVAFCLSVQARDGHLDKRQGMQAYTNCNKLANHVENQLNNYDDKLKDVTHDKDHDYFDHYHEDAIRHLMEHEQKAKYYNNLYKTSCGRNPPNYKAKEQCVKIMTDYQKMMPKRREIMRYNAPFFTITQQVLGVCQQI